MKTNKFKTGDFVEIVKYGHPIWSWAEIKGLKLIEQSDCGMLWYDLCPERVGKMDIVFQAKQTQGKWLYSLCENGAWYGENQLKQAMP